MAIDFSDVALAAAERLKGETYTAEPGRVQSRDGGFVDVVPMTRRAVDTAEGGHAYEDLPVVPNVPIAFPYSLTISVTWPVDPGSFGVLLHLTHSIAEFRRDGILSSPGDLRTHHLAHALFLPLFPGPDSAVPNSVEDTAIVLTAPMIKLGSKDATHFAAQDDKVAGRIAAIETALNAVQYTPGPSSAIFLFPGSPFTPTTATDVACTKVKLE